MEIESQLDKKVLSKYDEEIDGEKKSSFQLGECLLTRLITMFIKLTIFLSPLHNYNSAPSSLSS